MIKERAQRLVINTQLMKIIGFYQLLNPRSPMLFGYISLKSIIATIEAIYIIYGFTMFFIGLQYCKHDVYKAMFNLMLAVASGFSLFKYLYVFKNSDRIWKCMHLTSDTIFSYYKHKKEILQTGLEKSILFVNLFLVLWLCAITAYATSPIFLKDSYSILQIKNSTYKYRYNILNIIYPPSIISEKFYNEHYMIFYNIEIIGLLICMHAYLLYDIIVISMCIALAYQLKTIAHSYNTLIFINNQTVDTPHNRHLPYNETNNVKVEKPNDIVIKNLKILIDDLKIVIRNMRETYDIFRPITLVQLVSESALIIMQPCLLLMNYYNGISLTSLINISIGSLIFMNVFHLFFTCYFFGIINKEKDAINFALYSSDWTNQSIHFKKLLLLAMNINNAENLKMKVSFRRIVNLEMFADVIRITFSVISVWSKSYNKS